MWIDYGKTGKPKKYCKAKKVLKKIKSILLQDEMLLELVDIDNITNDRLFEIGANHYNIIEE